MGARRKRRERFRTLEEQHAPSGVRGSAGVVDLWRGLSVANAPRVSPPTDWNSAMLNMGTARPRLFQSLGELAIHKKLAQLATPEGRPWDGRAAALRAGRHNYGPAGTSRQSNPMESPIGSDGDVGRGEPVVRMV